VKEGEEIEAALWRAVLEETGLARLELVTRVGVYYYIHPETGNRHERHVFWLRAPEDTRDGWEWLETGGGEIPDHEGYVFQLG